MTVNAVYDGFVSKHINRRLSEPVAGMLAKTRLTPNQATWAAFCIAIASCVTFALGLNIIGGIIAQLSSIADGVDGGLARRKNMSTQFGGLLDAVLDRYADALIILGMTLWSFGNETYPIIWIVGFIAAVGTLTVSYSRARVSREYQTLFDRGFAFIASRDIRLFLIMIGGITGQVYFCLILIALLTNVVVFYRLGYARRFMTNQENAKSSTELKQD